MITTAEIVPLLLKACPEFSQTWEEHVGYWKGEPAGNYNDASAFVDFLIEYYERGQHDVLGRAFTVIEEMILDGDEDVRGVAIVGIWSRFRTGQVGCPTVLRRSFSICGRTHGRRGAKSSSGGLEGRA